jgi:hypothetical protein
MSKGVEFEVRVGIGKQGRYAKLWRTLSKWSPTIVDIRMSSVGAGGLNPDLDAAARPLVLKQLAVESLQHLVNKMNDEIERGDYT